MKIARYYKVCGTQCGPGQLLEMTDYRVSSERETAYRYTEYSYDARGRSKYD